LGKSLDSDQIYITPKEVSFFLNNPVKSISSNGSSLLVLTQKSRLYQLDARSADFRPIDFRSVNHISGCTTSAKRNIENFENRGEISIASTSSGALFIWSVLSCSRCIIPTVVRLPDGIQACDVSCSSSEVLVLSSE